MTFIPSDKNIKSTVNSSSTLLTAGSTFTGTSELNGFNDVMVSVKTDQNGTLYMDFSPDGTNWDSTLSFQYDTARINPPHILVKGARYYRTRFTNDSASDQTYLRLETDYGNFNKLTAPQNGTLSENYDALPTRPTDYFSEVAQGKRQGASIWNKFGYNDDVDVGTEVVASWGGTFTPLTTATTISIVSTSIFDTSAGTGCNSVVVYGIDSNRDEVIEVVTLNGTTPVVTTSTWLGINRVAMYLCGNGKVNGGEINITSTGAGTPTMAQMPLGGGVTQQCIFHVPNNHNFLAEQVWINVLNRGKNADLTVKMWVYSAVSNGNQEVFRVDIDTAAVSNPLDLNPNLPFPVSEKTVMWLECTSDSNNVAINARFSGVLERIV